MKVLNRWFARVGTTLALLGLAAGMGILAVGFLSAALYLALMQTLGAPLAALATGAALIAVAALAVLTIKVKVLPPRQGKGISAEPEGPATAAKLGEMLGEEAGTWTKRNPGTAMLVALAAGFVMGSSPKLRAKLLRLLR